MRLRFRFFPGRDLPGLFRRFRSRGALRPCEERNPGFRRHGFGDLEENRIEEFPGRAF